MPDHEPVQPTSRGDNVGASMITIIVVTSMMSFVPLGVLDDNPLLERQGTRVDRHTRSDGRGSGHAVGFDPAAGC